MLLHYANAGGLEAGPPTTLRHTILMLLPDTDSIPTAWLPRFQEEVVSLSRQLQQLREQFGQKTTEQLDLKAKADLMERRLTAASKLIVGLSSERTRWTADMQVDEP